MEQHVLQGRVALVTGGTTGLGFGAAKRLIEEGAFVYITGRRRDVLDAAAERLGPSARGIQADVSSKSDMLGVAETIKAGHGHLDIVFANAGGGHATPLAELTEEQIDSELGINVKGVILTVQSMLDVLGDGASIILNASITADMGLPGFAAYASSKAAVRSLARNWTTDLKDRRIRVNSVSPGVVPTEGYGHEQKLSDADIAAYVERVAKEIPAGRVGTAEDIGNAVVFLASDASSYINGIDLIVDGGMTRVYAGQN
ncbi:SDR family oxidoreductase [Streptomyces griseoloalbus]|uniref:NAD(P)-dependent dehydrogenase (Short-subunit alcohol dehydrogenase family) n=1 Tax=Streptomyces griseoloalbus TaxID=67303 RepID=A0A7W8BKL9_9ACTN|nr:SDR family oxidoreductase [Streptomyces albaduncus]MBB5125167.1 NAD(P)-dependent dehydrogenase (short-subunit alcohol dehydrogenase family) [Streptomyces albaduncus]GGW29641.1 short-chain dehydrogenase [Streptomyces albaduncus]